MKYMYYKLLTIAVLLIFVGCSENGNEQASSSILPLHNTAMKSESKPKERSPDQIILEYLDAGFDAGMAGKSKRTYNLLSEKDKEITTEKEYLSNSSSIKQEVSFEIINAVMKMISYKIVSSVIEGDTANIEIETSIPRFPPDIRKLMLKENTPEMQNKILGYLNRPDLEMDKSKSSYKLLKESSGWRVFLDFKRKKLISTLLEDAEEIVPSVSMLGPIDGAKLESMKNNLLLAEKKYNKVLSLDDHFIAQNNLKHLKQQINKLSFYEANKESVEIRNVSVGKSKRGGMGVFGEVKNKSKVPLTKVGITVYFLDKNGSPIHEESRHPVYVTDRSYGDEAMPLKPNYSRKFGVNADEAPYEWSKKVKVVISDLEAK